MTDTDDTRIHAALKAEEQRLLDQIGEDPPFFDQVWSLFRNRNAWVTWLLMVSQTALFIASVYAGWRFYQATDVLSALHWGLPAAIMLLMSLIIKLALWPIAQIGLLRRDLIRFARLETEG